ncbi:MAG: hypothetical protein IT285_16170 [Bdellovibrionales bacterium]|nr:hypothetical protein [Bdellovibrionales bacterium]
MSTVFHSKQVLRERAIRLVERVLAKELGRGGPSLQDMDDISMAMRAVVHAAFPGMHEDDVPVQVGVLDLGRYQRMRYEPVPYAHVNRHGHDEAVLRNLVTAAEDSREAMGRLGRVRGGR